MVHVIDTFNDRLISSHRSLKAAVKAESKYQAAVKAANGEHSYIPTAFVVGGSKWRDCERVDDDDVAMICATL